MKVTVVISALDTVIKGLVKGLEDLEIRGWMERIQTIHIVEIGQNAEQCSGELRRLVTPNPVKDYQLTLMWNTLKL